MSRSRACTSLTTRSPIRMRPEVISSSPAIMRSSVDLPQPDGPTSTQNSPSAISTSTPCTTSVAPYDLRTFSIETDAKVRFPKGVCAQWYRRSRAVDPGQTRRSPASAGYADESRGRFRRLVARTAGRYARAKARGIGTLSATGHRGVVAPRGRVATPVLAPGRARVGIHRAHRARLARSRRWHHTGRTGDLDGSHVPVDARGPRHARGRARGRATKRAPHARRVRASRGDVAERIGPHARARIRARRNPTPVVDREAGRAASSVRAWRTRMRRTIPTTPPDFDHTRVIERPDGF